MNYLYKLIKYLQKHRLLIFLAIFFTSWVLYVCGFGHNIFLALYNSMALFALDVRIPTVDIVHWWQNFIYVLGALAGIYTVLTIIEQFIKNQLKDNLIRETINEGNHIIVIGLGESNKVYVDSEIKNSKHKIVVVEKDNGNPYLHMYQDKLALIIADATEKSELQKLSIENSKHIVVSTGDDMANLEIASLLLSLNKDIKLFVHFEDRNLRHFHKENGILSGTNIKVYSYHEEAARELFDKYDIDGDNMNVITTDMPYAISVVGNTSLAYEVVAQACIMGQLPNENKLTIYCIDKNISSFKQSVELHFPQIAQVPNVIIEYVELDPHTKAFYLDKVWDVPMTNIVLCFPDDQTNLDIASNLTNLTFLEKVVDKEMTTNILLAMFNGYSISENIKQNTEMFKHLHVFGCIEEINDEKYVIAGERDNQAIVTNFIYENIGPKLIDFEKYDYEYYAYNDENYSNEQFIKSDDISWASLSYFKKESNRAVADQMKMKLKYLGLKVLESNRNDVKTTFEINKSLFDEKIKDRNKLAKMEHNRWNTFHYLNGFKPIPFVSKKEKVSMKNIHEDKKVHMCLIEFDEFKDKSQKLLELGYKKGEFEGYDFLINEHIPLILANAGYLINEK